jgi:metal-sulfur cluster biosynthetic enzyme
VDRVRAYRNVYRRQPGADGGALAVRVAGSALSKPERTDMSADGTETKAEKASPIVAEAEKQEKILNALQAVLDPEIGLSVIDLDLIREVVFTPEEAEVKMVLTTPFCPYGPMLINQIQSVSEQAAEMPVKVTVLPDHWEPPPWLR